MPDARQILRDARSVLVVDWPSRDVPEGLVRAGFEVVVQGGPDTYSRWQLRDGALARVPIDGSPDHVDLVYCHRPIGELPGIVALAVRLGASALWRQSALAAEGVTDPTGCWLPAGESQEGRRLAESAGLAYVDDVYIADAVTG